MKDYLQNENESDCREKYRTYSKQVKNCQIRELLMQKIKHAKKFRNVGDPDKKVTTKTAEQTRSG